MPTDPMHDIVDVHFHVGPRGEPDTEHGGVSDTLRNTWPLYDIMLLYLRIKKGEDTDEKFK